MANRKTSVVISMRTCQYLVSNTIITSLLLENNLIIPIGSQHYSRGLKMNYAGKYQQRVHRSENPNFSQDVV